ncbi:MAG: peptide-methionine (R)-S-oxide reductase MsrB [Raineya sp.]|nr:peptide-methionine (R)-S-oxide reductase MsrB [Raineya sp.]MDW8295880.1 peptide-methionine (R)-S-oxide reductase MsrB [Raineya sp.]
MKRNILVVLLFWLLILQACGQNKENQTAKKMGKNFEVKKTEQEWQHCLSPEQYRVLRLKGTERAFTGKFYKHNEKGIYICAGCGNELFKSETKFDSGTGWPSYYDAIPGAVVLETDYSYGMIRTEVLCAKCGGHLGHVFDDGPQPTGLRYCINSVSLDFKKQ